MSTDLEGLRKDIQLVGEKVDSIQRSHDSDRIFLNGLHKDHVRLEERVAQSESIILRTQSDLDKHIEIACLIQQSIKEDVKETKEVIKEHIASGNADQAEIIKYLREAVNAAKKDGWTNLKWAVGIGVSTVVTLFALLWATGTVGTQ
jgi:hypothetical protein